MIDSSKITNEIHRANDKEVWCEQEGDHVAKEAWYGYVKALRWVEAQGIPTWIKPTDRLPELGQVVLIHVLDTDEHPVAKFTTYNGEPSFRVVCCEYPLDIDEVAYWMPMPEPPMIQETDQ